MFVRHSEYIFPDYHGELNCTEWDKLLKTLLWNGTQKVQLVNTLFYPLSQGSRYCWRQDTEQGGSLFWPTLAFLTSSFYVVLVHRHCLLSQQPTVGLESFVFHALIRISIIFSLSTVTHHFPFLIRCFMQEFIHLVFFSIFTCFSWLLTTKAYFRLQNSCKDIHKDSGMWANYCF